ncbi:MAG: hypothetical protein F4X83_06050 [Chloroflexi bacterium]|nr:hypothetical protein [Chloroflexota bacterium]
MKILGGSYQETCEVPGSDVVVGSGLRAAGAIAEVAMPTLHTAVDGIFQVEVELAAGGLHVELSWVERDKPVGFHYFTPISRPTISGPQAVADALHVEGDVVLAFGMVECGERAVDCRRLVIDPQRPQDSSRLDLGPYRHEQLALVCNSSEIRALGSGVGGVPDLV